MFETLDNILQVIFFIAVGGLVAIVFFFVFAQTIIGSRTIHKQLDKIIEQNEKIGELLKKLHAGGDNKKQPKQ